MACAFMVPMPKKNRETHEKDEVPEAPKDDSISEKPWQCSLAALRYKPV
jgi:hypothetical protein